MSTLKLDTLNKSAELLDAYLDAISDEEFLEMHDSVKSDDGITMNHFFHCNFSSFDFIMGGIHSHDKAKVFSESSLPIVWSNVSSSSVNFIGGANDDAYSQIGEAA